MGRESQLCQRSTTHLDVLFEARTQHTRATTPHAIDAGNSKSVASTKIFGETVDVAGDDVASGDGQPEIFDLSEGSDAAGDGGSDCDGESQEDSGSPVQQQHDAGSPVEVHVDDRMSLGDLQSGRHAVDGGPEDHGSFIRCGGMKYQVPDINEAHLSYSFALHSQMELPWTYVGDGATLSLFAKATRLSTACTGIASPDGGPCILCDALLYSNRLQGIRKRAKCGAEDSEKMGAFFNTQYLTCEQLSDRCLRHKNDKQTLRLLLFNATKKVLKFSKNIDGYKRMTMMLATDDVPGLRRVFAKALRKGTSIHKLLNQLTRAVNRRYRVRRHDERSIELATVIIRLGGPAVLRVLHEAGNLPGVSAVQARLQKSPWLAGYADIAVHVRENVPREAKILIVGCGNSSLSADMFDDGYRDVLSTDFSSVVIEKMSARNEARLPGLRWERMDMLALDLPDASVDAVLDKAAMDALMVDRGDPWHPSPGVVSQAHRLCSEVSRVLAPGGVYIQLSFEQPHFRRKMLLGENIRAYREADNPVGAGGGGGGVGSSYRGSDLTASGSETDETDETCSARTSVPGHLVETTQGPRPSGGEARCADVGDDETGDDVRYSHRRFPPQGARLEVDRGFYGWDLETHEIQRESGCFGHFLYVMRKSRG